MCFQDGIDERQHIVGIFNVKINTNVLVNESIDMSKFQTSSSGMNSE